MSEVVFKIRKEGYTITLSNDVRDWEYFDSMKNDEDPPIRYRIIVKINAEIIAEYVRTFEKEPSPVYLTNYFKKIIGDSNYRKKYVEKGEWDEVVRWEDRVNPQTRQKIEHLNNIPMSKLRFKDFMNLKVGGKDGYSRMSDNQLNRLLAESDKRIIEQQLDNEKMMLSAKKWVVRGLQVQKAIRKVKTDEEVGQNTRKKR